MHSPMSSGTWCARERKMGRDRSWKVPLGRRIQSSGAESSERMMLEAGNSWTQKRSQTTVAE